MEPLTRRALFSSAFREAVEGDPLTLVDVGARGGLEEPWRSLPPAALQVVGFEPDREECARLTASAPPGHRFLPVALWNEARDVEVHVAAVPSCSSVHPPNAELLERYEHEHAAPRETKGVVSYAAATLDEVTRRESIRCDVLKVDTQGSEGEILRGGLETISRDVLCAIVETWTVPVHAGQALTGDVMRLMDDLGMTLFDIAVAAAWHRPLPPGVELERKRQVTGLDLLFLREEAPPADETRLCKLAAVADVFGFPDLALGLLASRESPRCRALSDAIVAGGRTVLSRAGGMLGSVRRRVPAAPGFAPLHS